MDVQARDPECVGALQASLQKSAAVISAVGIDGHVHTEPRRVCGVEVASLVSSSSPHHPSFVSSSVCIDALLNVDMLHICELFVPFYTEAAPKSAYAKTTWRRQLMMIWISV